MTLQNTFPAPSSMSIFGFMRRMRSSSAPLYWTGLALLAMCIPTLALAGLDARLFQGVSVWLKPLKFQLSTGVYLLSLAFFMGWLQADDLRSKKAQYLVWAAVVSGIFEVIYITAQGAQGLGSHFNLSSRFYANMYTLMGVAAVVLTSSSLVCAILIARSRSYALPPALKLSVVLGLLLTFVLGTGFGGYLSAQRAGHWVGGALVNGAFTDSGGLPLFKWSRSGGDLRVAHFFGLHAMHFIPAFALVLAWAKLPQRSAQLAIWGFAVAYTAFCVWTFVQATRGLPFLAI
jgi:hypothetical protein